AVVAAVGVKGPRFRLIPEPAQHGCQLGHLSESVAFGSVSGVDGLGGTVVDGPGDGWSFVASAATFVSSGAACESVASAASGAVMSSAWATRRPARVAPPTSRPDPRESGSPARVLAVSWNVHSGAPRVGTGGSPARSPSTRSRADDGVWLSKNSQLTITTGAYSHAALHSTCSRVTRPSSVVWPAWI